MNSKFSDFSTKRGRIFIAIIIIAVLILLVAFGFEGDMMRSPSTVMNFSNMYDPFSNNTVTSTVSNFDVMDSGTYSGPQQ